MREEDGPCAANQGIKDLHPDDDGNVNKEGADLGFDGSGTKLCQKRTRRKLEAAMTAVGSDLAIAVVSDIVRGPV